jgi:hypothetical protein
MIWITDMFAQSRTQPRRALALEIACLVPALALAAGAGFGWGGYFWLQGRVQEAANRGLQAAAAAADPAHSRALARAAAEQVLGGPLADLDLRSARGGQPTLRLAYDASHSPVFALARISPMPSPIIVRLASQP